MAHYKQKLSKWFYFIKVCVAILIASFSVCCCIIITGVGTLWWASFFKKKPLDRNGSVSNKLRIAGFFALFPFPTYLCDEGLTDVRENFPLDRFF